MSAERRVFSIVLAPVAAVGWIVFALTGLAVRVALLREHRTHGLVSLFWAFGFALLIWAGVAVLGVPERRAIPFALIAGGAIALLVYLRGAALDDLAVGRPGAYHRRRLARRRSGSASPAPSRGRPGRTRELDLARIKLDRGEPREALPLLKEAERVAVAQRKLDELVEVRELVRVLAARGRGRTKDASERLARKVEEQLQSFPAEELAAVGIRKAPSREELEARFVHDQLASWATRNRAVTTTELTLARTALASGKFGAVLYHLEEARRIAVAQRRLDELLEVHTIAQALSERSEGRSHAASARLILKVDAGVRSFAPPT